MFTVFLKHLNSMMQGESNSKLEATDPRDYLKKLFAIDRKLYQGCELILQVLAVAITKSSVESYIESYVSVYEYHFNQRRTLSEENMNAEMTVAVNGPKETNCDKLVESSLNAYFSSNNWRFFRKDDPRNIEYTFGSPVLDKLNSEKNKLPFM